MKMPVVWAVLSPWERKMLCLFVVSSVAYIFLCGTYFSFFPGFGAGFACVQLVRSLKQNK
jgi:hypothetical protein